MIDALLPYELLHLKVQSLNGGTILGNTGCGGQMEESTSLGAESLSGAPLFCSLPLVLHFFPSPHSEPRTSGAKDYGLKSLKTRLTINCPCLNLVLSGALLRFQ